MSARKTPADPGPGVGRIQALVGPSIECHLPKVFRFLRRRCPILTLPGLAVVVGDAEVRQVLARRDDFSVARYTHKIMEVTGPFALGFDDPPHYDPAHHLLLSVVRRADIPQLAIRAADLAASALAAAALGTETIGAASPPGTFDVVGDFLDPVLASLVEEYLGIGGLDPSHLQRWSRTVFTEIFISPKPFVRPAAMKVVQDFRTHINAIVAARRGAAAGRGDGAGRGAAAGGGAGTGRGTAAERGPGAGRDDVLGRLLAGGTPDSQVTGTLLGLVVAWIPNMSKTLTLAIDELLNRPEELRAAHDAAARGDDDALAGLIFEAARFRPQGPGIFRVAARTCQLGVDSPRVIRAGTTVFAATASAMMDDAAVDAPGEFRPDRPWSEYLHFGYGVHTCLGQAISRAVMPAMTRALLLPGPITRAAGNAGRLAWRYPYPSHLKVCRAPAPLTP